MISVFIFLFGLAIGSFLNVVIFRLPQGQNFVTGRSKCLACGHLLNWKDLLPLVSFLLLKGKCRYCSKKIKESYFVVEILTAFVFMALFFLFQSDWMILIFWAAVASLLIVLVFIDFYYLVIPDKILIVLGLLGLLEHIFLGRPLNILLNLLTGTVTGVLFFLIYWLTNVYYQEGGMGFGDVKLVALLGFIFGFPAILSVIYLALLASLIAGLILILFFKKGLKTKLPFGSFLGGAAIFFILFNQFLGPVLTPYIFRLYL